MTDDEPFEQFLKDAAADYGAPRGELPREAMWEAIRDRRAPSAGSSAAAAVSRHSPRTRLWIGLAATLLLGVAIGRYAWDRATPVVAAVQPTASVVPPAPLQKPAAAARAETEAVTVPDARRRTPDNRALPGASNTTYSLVAARHLADVEALLTSYTSSSTDARSDSLLGAWAKNLLSNTRLLLDSPAAHDPVRARLLSDLEVILVQLVQRSPGGDAEERSTVERALQKSQLIPRLRSAVPAGLHSGTD
jgi:hypothetical protein